MEDQGYNQFCLRTEIPDMSNWHNKIDVTYSVSTYFFLSNFNTTTVTDDPLYGFFYISTSTFKIFTGPKIRSQKVPSSRSGFSICSLVPGFNTSPLDSFKIDSGEASPIEILLNLYRVLSFIVIIFIII
jgi:hypothetical protein